jgi:uncharacterized membrane protein
MSRASGRNPRFFENWIISPVQAWSTSGMANHDFFLPSSLIPYVMFALLVLIRNHRTCLLRGAQLLRRFRYGESARQLCSRP